MKFRRIIFFILSILVCICIFRFSNEKSEETKNTSGKVVNVVMDEFHKKDPELKKNKNKEKSLKEKVTFYVRKTAHFTIFALLGFCITNFFYTFDSSAKKKFLFCILFCILYAISDEIHQFFVSGRDCEVRDTLIDTIGSTVGISIGFLINKIAKKIHFQLTKTVTHDKIGNCKPPRSGS